MKHAVEVTILGQQFTLRSDASPDEARRVADFVNQKIDDISAHSSADSLRTVVLAMLNVSGSYLQLRDSGACLTGEVEQRLETLAARLEAENGVEEPAEPGLFDH